MWGISTSFVELIISTLTTICAVGVVVFKLGRAIEKFESVGRQQAREIAGMQVELKVITQVVKDLALQNQRQDMLEERLNRTEQIVDDIRRGEGFILPLNPRP